MNRALCCLTVVLTAVLAFPPLAFADEVPVTGPEVAGLEPFDKLMQNFLSEHHGVGATLAVTRSGKLVYARGFGWADRETRRKVEPGSLFRIASLTKPITSALVLHLWEQGKLNLKDEPFRMLAVKPVLEEKARPDPRLERITVLELLQHRGGFDRDVSLDPMSQSVPFAKLCGTPPPALQEEIIRVMAGRRLDFPPGERYAYSNIGYCVLGRVIEHVTGEKYEAAVKREILEPLKIKHMQLGRTLLKERAAGEVRYYTVHDETGSRVFPPMGHKTPLPYGSFCLEAMDSHGGWIASAAELVKFASALDDPAASGILKKETVALMFSRPPGAAGLEGNKPGAKPADSWYGCGWSVREAGGGGINTWHTGMLDGTSTLMVRRSDGLDWVVLFNQDRDEKGKFLADEIDPLLHRAAGAVKQWPAGLERDKDWP